VELFEAEALDAAVIQVAALTESLQARAVRVALSAAARIELAVRSRGCRTKEEPMSVERRCVRARVVIVPFCTHFLFSSRWKP
jgi:hypothetical protein